MVANKKNDASSESNQIEKIDNFQNKDENSVSKYKSDDLKNKVSFNINNPLSPVSCTSFPPEAGCDLNTKQNEIQMINRFGTESTSEAIKDAVRFLESKNLIPKIKNNKGLNRIATNKINYSSLISETGNTNSKNGEIYLGNDAFKSKGLLRAVVLHELLHRKDFINGDMFKYTVYDRHMKIYPEVIKAKNVLDMSTDDILSYTRKYMSVKSSKKEEENWIPKR